MDSYEKRYKEALNKAKASYGTGAYDDQTLEAIFPELAESEDARKEIVQFLKICIGDNKFMAYTPDDVKRWIAYLEKQKESHYTKRNALFDKCVAECDPAIMKTVSDGIDDMLRKEQKSIQFKNNELVDLIKGEFEGFRTLLKKKGIDYEPQRSYWEGFARVFDSSAREYVIEQKSDTRTADDLQLLGFIYDLLASLDWRENYAMSKEECLRRLNEYRPQKPSWSEEDERTRQNLMSLLANMRGDRIKEETYNKYYPWLQSLRNGIFQNGNTHWKPSEEQIYSLGTVVKGYNECTVGSVGYNLKELYEHLKKL